LTVTHFPRRRLTFGIFFGCTVATEKQVFNRIIRAKENAFHPLVLPGIFAELERARMVEVVEDTVDEIEGAIFELNSGTTVRENRNTARTDGRPSGIRFDRRRVWLNTTFLRSRLQIWKTQLEKLVQNVDELSSSDYSSRSMLLSDFGLINGLEQPQYVRVHDAQLKRTGFLIKDRLEGIIDEYQEKIEECSMRVDGMAIATQWVRLMHHASCKQK
jgi:hypothetical protein